MTGGESDSRRFLGRRKSMNNERNIKRQVPLPLFYKSTDMKTAGMPAGEKAASGKAENAATGKSVEQATEVQKKAERHRFKLGIDMVQPVSGIGDVYTQTVKHEIESSDENYFAGLQEERKYVHPAMDLAAIVGAKELSKGLKAELNQLTITGIRVNELIREGTLSMVDLGDRKLLKERLETIEGLTAFQKRQIRKFREPVYDFIVIRDAIQKRRGVMEKIEEPLKEHLKSADLFNLRQQKTNELLKVYFKTSQNDVLKNVNPAAMSEKGIAKLLKSRDRNGFAETDLSALRLVRRQMKYRESRIRTGRLLNIKRRVEMLGAYSYSVDGNVSAGLTQMAYTAQITHAAFAVGKFGLKAGIVSASFAAKYTGVSYLLHKLNQKRKEVTEQLKIKATEAVKSSKPYQAVHEKVQTVKEKTSDVKRSVDQKLEQNSAVQKYKEVQAKAREKVKVAGKKASRTKAAAKAAGRKVKQGKDIALTPIRLAGKAINGIRVFFHKIRMILFVGAGIAISAFLIIVVLTNAILTIFQTESDAALSAILSENENFIADMTTTLQEKADDKRLEAETIANGTPKNAAVLEGHTISRYGHPGGNGGWVGGSRIVYLDGKGNVTLNGMNNIKDCIVMAYVIMDGDFDSNEKARNDLIFDLWELMNPKVTYQESDIYTCTNGCDSYSYSCDSSDDYTTINAYKESGVGFYGDIESYSAYGDGYRVTCDGCKDNKNKTIYHDTQTGTGAAQPASGCENYSVDYQCSGHSVTVCFGHKDVEVYVTVISMEEMFVNRQLPAITGNTYQSYLNEFQGWTEDNQEWARLLYSGDWFELYGVDPSGGTGYVAGSGMTPEEIAAIVDTYGNLDATRTAICSDAMSFVGQIPYYWGGKAVAKEYAENGFNATVTPDYKGRNKRGLDCSGFVQWIFWRVTDVQIRASTSTITEGMQPISVTELQPGDLGLMALPGSASNHVGIFVGYNEQGQALWCHENSSAGNVSVNNTTCFRYYYRIL